MDPFHFIFRLEFAALISLRLYWHWRAGTTRDRAAVRAGLAREGAFARVRVLLALPGLVLLVVYLFAPSWLRWSEVPLAASLRWAGAGLFLAALLLLVWVHAALGRNFNTTLVVRGDHELIMRGPYRYVRHPMYSAFALLFTGMFLLSANLLLGLLGGVVFLFLVAGRTPREEAQLQERFGAAYEAYRARTGALVPRFGRRAG